MMVSERFLRNVRFCCKMKGIKTAEIEDFVGVAHGYVSERVNRHHAVKLDDAVKFAELAGQPIDRLCTAEIDKKGRHLIWAGNAI